MSLLGRLLSGAGVPSATSPKNLLDSNLEDQFTYNLLFPDAEALCHNDQVFPLSSGTVLTPAAANTFDFNGEIDMELRDVRVIIMQEATQTSGSAYLLYDSHTPPPSPSVDRQSTSNGSGPPSRSEGRRSISSPRKPSIGQTSRPVIIQQEPTAPRGFGAFDRRPTHNKTLSYTETDGQRSAREYREEVTTISNCIFGNSDVLAYKGTGTKVHILPSEGKTSTFGSYVGDGSLGRSSMRGSKLAQSFTSGNVAGPTSAGFAGQTATSRGSDRKKVLITRMFPVPLPNDEPEPEESALDRTPTVGMTVDPNLDTRGYPFPQVPGSGNESERKRPQPKQKRTPMYAVGLVIHLPPAPYTPPVLPSRSSFRAPGSFTEQESMPSSFNSTRRAGWTMLGHGFGVESLETSYCSDVDDRIDTITQHWDIIMRTLSHLQSTTSTSLLPILRQADISSPHPRRGSISHGRAPSSSISIAGKRVLEDVKPFKVPKTNAKMVQVMANCLQHNPTIIKEVDNSRQRILSGIKAHQVVTGQGRWGIWREEARLVNKWAGGKDEGFFFFNLLTGFLGNHTEWLQALGPSWYRRRHYQQQRASKDDDVSLPARTVIISDNKVMARRLIFLLAAFLPANQQLPTSRLHRPSTSTSFGGYSQSPPSLYTVPILREESLRRRINKRSNAVHATSKSSHSRAMSFPAQTLSHAPPRIPLDIHHDRNSSDAASIKTANLPIPGSDLHTRKSSTATASTATPITTTPHFSTRRSIRGTGPIPRPGSSGSLATDDLIRSLKRNDSTSQYSNVSSDSQGYNSKWGSMISGFWSSKRRDSSASTSIEPLSVEGLDINQSQNRSNQSQRKCKLAQMVDEVTYSPLQVTNDQKERETRRSDGSATTAKPDGDQIEDIAEQVIRTRERVPDPSGAYQSPVKTSINEHDGVIDIDVPLPDYLAFETAVSSPSSSGYLSTPGFGNGLDGFEHYSRPGAEFETTLNVGGWLPSYNPDFALQAIPSQPNLIEEIKKSMRAEPTPVLTSTPQIDGSRQDRWVDITSAVVADTRNFTIKHILYRRLVRFKDHDHNISSLPNSLDSRYGNVYLAAQLTPNIDVYDGHIDEKFIEEPIISLDDTLVEAIERIIAQSGQVSMDSSVCSSRSTSRRDRNRERSNSVDRSGGTQVPEHILEVPKSECKRMVLHALEEIVKEVVEGRREGNGAGGGENVDGARERGLERAESFLREGVRNWLVNVEGLE